MMKYIYIFMLALSCTIACPADAIASTAIEIIDMEQPIVSQTGTSTLHVQNANGMVLYVYDVAGVIVKTIQIDGPDRHIDLNLSKGCYIIKVGKIVRKISVR